MIVFKLIPVLKQMPVVLKLVKSGWHVAAVEKLPHAIRVKSNSWESLRDSQDDDEDEDEDAD
eukprot:6095763-Karenia_brevis.AAC.1